MAELWLIKVDGVLVGEGNEANDAMAKLPSGVPLQCEVKRPRSAKHNRLYWKICARIATALDRTDIDSEKVSDFFKRATGHYEEIETKTWGTIIRLKSISFAKMDQIAFREFFEKCIRFATTEWGIPYDTFGDLLGEIGTEKR